MSQKTSTLLFFEQPCQKLTDFNNSGMLNPQKIWHEDLTDLSTSPVRCSLGKSPPPKKFSTLLFINFRLFTLPQRKTNSNCCTALAVYLLLFSASYYLHSPSTASACTDKDMLWLATEACCNMGWMSAQRGVLCDWSVSKKTGSMY